MTDTSVPHVLNDTNICYRELKDTPYPMVSLLETTVIFN